MCIGLNFCSGGFDLCIGLNFCDDVDVRSVKVISWPNLSV